MLLRLIKILSCVLVIAIIISISIAPIHAHAIAAPIIVGGTALAIGGLAWAISSAMGVDLAINNQTISTIGDWFNPFYSVQTTLSTSDFEFIKGLRTGYDALRLSLAAYNAIKEGSKELIETYGIQPYDSGTYQTVGYLADLPVFYNGTTYQTPWYTFNVGDTFSYGNTTIVSGASYMNKFYYVVINDRIGPSYDGVRYSDPIGSPAQLCYISSNPSSGSGQYFLKCPYFPNGYDYSGGVSGLSYSAGGKDFDYTSTDVNTSFGQTALDNLTVVFPETVLPSSATLSEIMEALNSFALDDEQDISVEIDVAPTPTPTPIPIPTTPLGDVPFDQFVDIYGQTVTEAIDNQTDVIDTFGQSVYGELESQTDALDAIGQSIDGIDSTLTTIDTNVASSTGLLGQIKNGVQSLVNSVTGTISNTLSGILTEVQALVDEIVLSTETFIAGLLNTIPTAFQTIWDTMKSAFSIWHYVVEWFTSISSPFTWIWGIASGTSYYIILPIYASLAGAVVLAFYKRFGK